ncbi:helix-turn-helix domain-containing protein [Paenibacillus kandeliae]|uniref:helix-turn-helix domain-containing protein n=1 Tax=Paenibacillus kandeliae TaxID=3231269 RepID=UPI003458B492
MTKINQSKIQGKITLKEARENLKKTIAQVSLKTGIPQKTILRYEIDCSKAKHENLIKLIKEYDIAFDHIYLGKAEHVHNLRRGLEVDILLLLENKLKEYGVDAKDIRSEVKQMSEEVNDYMTQEANAEIKRIALELIEDQAKKDIDFIVAQ